jgi:Zn finger protein HypA/HybF involved in hydrogenase expression
MEHPDLDLNLGEFSWCLYCECVHKTTSWQANGWECPGCGAGSFDLRPWEEILALVQDYPERPEEGQQYLQYVR